MTYEEFLKTKDLERIEAGFKVQKGRLNEALFPNGRRGLGIELKTAYYKCAVNNLKAAEKVNKQMDIFQFIGGEES